MDEWAKYIAGVETRPRKPSWFADGTAVRVYQNYADLMNKIAERVIRRSSLPEFELIAVGTPLTELIIEVAGAQRRWYGFQLFQGIDLEPIRCLK